jgi:hypothetical protein
MIAKVSNFEKNENNSKKDLLLIDKNVKNKNIINDNLENENNIQRNKNNIEQVK